MSGEGDRSLVESAALWARAQQVIPRGVYGHQNAESHGALHPRFLARGAGSRVWDVDGNEYVDWMCAYGPMVLGYRNPVVDRAVAEQMELGDTLSLPGEPMVEYADGRITLDGTNHGPLGPGAHVRLEKDGTLLVDGEVRRPVE